MGAVLSAVLGGSRDAAAASDSLSKDVAKEFNVAGMPTFVLVKRGKEADRVVGANKDQLERKVSELRA